MATRITRRRFLGGTVAVVLVACTSDSDGDSATTSTSTASSSTTSTTIQAVAAPESPFASNPFTLGVGAGDPLTDSLILWTRLSPELGEDVEIAFDVATDLDFEDLVASDVVAATVEFAHSVHLELTELEPATTYHYRFRVGEHTSTAGRARTTPEPGDDAPFTFVFASCQRYEDGYWAAHRHLVEEDPHLVVWLGDFIYEGAGNGVRDGKVRSHDGPEPRTLEEYRRRYSQYRLEPELQAAQATAAWAVTWDDHEVVDNYAGDVGDGSEAPDEFLARRSAAYQAWYEHQPVRLPPPEGPTYDITRTIDVGDLVAFHMIDSRQFRSDQACDVSGDLGEPCAEVDDEGRTMLGDAQEKWLETAYSESSAVWDVLANQTVLAPSKISLGPLSAANLDQWDGYTAARRRVYETLQKVDNPIVITGDIHASLVSDLTVHPDDSRSEVFATEFVCTSISSSFPARLVTAFEAAMALKPLTKYANAKQRGYVRCDVDRSTFAASYRLLDDALDPDSGIATAATFELTAGAPGATKI